MARRTFDVIDVAEILVHWHAGRTLSEMAGSLGVDRTTLRKYVAPAVAAGIGPGGARKGEGWGGGRGGGVAVPPAGGGGGGAGGELGELPPLRERECAGGGPPVAGDGVEPAPGRGRGAGADRLRAAGPVAGPGLREAAHRLGVRDGAGLFAAHVRAAGPDDGPACLDRVQHCRLRVLRRRAGPACPR